MPELHICGSIIGGCALYVLAVVLVFWNEGRYVKNKKLWEEASKNLKEIACTASPPDYDGNLVFLKNCPLGTTNYSASTFGFTNLKRVETRPGIWAKAQVQIYQVAVDQIQKCKTVPDGKTKNGKPKTKQECTTTYTDPTNKWAEGLNKFCYSQPKCTSIQVRPCSSAITTQCYPSFATASGEAWSHKVPKVYVKKFLVPDTLRSNVRSSKYLSVGPVDKYVKPAKMPQEKTQVVDTSTTKITDDGHEWLEIGRAGDLGNVRVSFQTNAVNTVTILAKVQGDTFVPFVSKYDIRGGVKRSNG
eukprot:NODE_1187_length_1051_cov_172.143713_g910_i0.p1 GENE.NODE_1187_length_1051_cov_172.143713_g910_i0~~NODE_1187_length_1051_cov_172.143713_g910_i0.p1  ORF type:complete len:319 (+),score=52.24 NODE_1187_length_1051_cov_172.143713_g910_i0:54-959(+)